MCDGEVALLLGVLKHFKSKSTDESVSEVVHQYQQPPPQSQIKPHRHHEGGVIISIIFRDFRMINYTQLVLLSNFWMTSTQYLEDKISFILFNRLPTMPSLKYSRLLRLKMLFACIMILNYWIAYSWLVSLGLFSDLYSLLQTSWPSFKYTHTCLPYVTNTFQRLALLILSNYPSTSNHQVSLLHINFGPFIPLSNTLPYFPQV